MMDVDELRAKELGFVFSKREGLYLLWKNGSDREIARVAPEAMALITSYTHDRETEARIADEYDTLFKGYDLAPLMIDEKNGKKQIKKSLEYGTYKLLKAHLSLYGIHLGGGVNIGEYQVKAIGITPDFDVRNELIIRQLYSFNCGAVNIQLFGMETNGECAYAFDYDLSSYACTFQKHVYGNIEESIKYDTLADMLTALKEGEKTNG
jgi:hypothetical protein